MSEQIPVQTVSNKNPYQIAEPQSQLGLTEVIEAGEIPVRYLNRYHTDHDVRCAFCDNHTHHRRGFTAIMKDGRTALCGIDCGRKYFGDEVAKNFERALQKTEDEAKRDAILAAAMEDLPKLQREVRVKWLPLQREVDDIMRALPRFGESLLRRQITDGGEFVVTDVEVKWVELPSGGQKPIEMEVERGRVRGAQILFMKSDRFERVQGNLTAVLQRRDYLGRPIGDSQRLSNRMSLTQTVADALNYLEVASIFFDKDNIREFDKALRHYRNDGAKIDWKRRQDGPGVIRIRDGNMERTCFSLPDLSDLPNTADLAPPIRYLDI